MGSTFSMRLNLDKILKENGFGNFLMTGCPVFYELNSDKQNSLDAKVTVGKVAFSLGVSFVESKSMERLMKELILDLQEQFKGKDFEVVFHHAIGKSSLENKNFVTPLFEKQKEFTHWLDMKGVKYVDISGGHESMLDYYQSVDYHVGFRVHAHILMSSWNKPSILLSEDSRAISFKDVLGGGILAIHKTRANSKLFKILSKLSLIENVEPISGAYSLIQKEIKNDLSNNFANRNLVRVNINRHYKVMTEFIRQLP